MNLSGKTLVVGGGTGDVGVEIVGALTSRGARVIVPARDADKAQRLLDSVSSPERITVLHTAPVNEASVAALTDTLRGIARIDGAVAALGSWFSFGPLVTTPAEGFETAWRSLLLSHFLFARAVLPVLPAGASYILLNGGAAEAPVPHSSATSIHAHAVSMLYETIKAEHPDLKVHLMMLRSIIATRARPQADPSWITAQEVGQTAAWLLTPEGALTAGSVLGLQMKR